MWLQFNSYLLNIKSTRKNTVHNSSVYVIGSPHRENFLAKGDC